MINDSHTYCQATARPSGQFVRKAFFNQTEENFIFLIFLKTDGTNSPRFLFVNTEGNDAGITRKSR